MTLVLQSWRTSPLRRYYMDLRLLEEVSEKSASMHPAAGMTAFLDPPGCSV